eukprot:2310148-Prymnesium_polylepis.1
MPVATLAQPTGMVVDANGPRARSVTSAGIIVAVAAAAAAHPSGSGAGRCGHGLRGLVPFR